MYVIDLHYNMLERNEDFYYHDHFEHYFANAKCYGLLHSQCCWVPKAKQTKGLFQNIKGHLQININGLLVFHLLFYGKHAPKLEMRESYGPSY